MWVGILPCLAGAVFIVHAINLHASVTLEETKGDIVLHYRKWPHAVKNLPLQAIRYVSLQYHKTKTWKWVVIFVLLLHAIEVLYRNGMDLLGAAPVAPFLLLNALLTAIGVMILTAFPRRFLEIGTHKSFASIPWPPHKTNETMKNNFLTHLGVDPTSLQRATTSPHIREILCEDFSTFIFAVVLLLAGITLMLFPAIFFGQFTAPLVFTLGVNALFQILNGGKFYIQQTESAFLGLSRGLTFFHGSIGSVERRDVVSLANFRPLELLGYIYLISQSVKYGFRFIWWPYMGFGPGQFVLGLVLIGLVVCRVFSPAHQIRCQLSGFPLVLRTPLSTSQATTRPSLIRTKLQDFFSAFRAHKGEKTFLWVVIFLFLAVITPGICLAWGGSSLLF